MRLAKYENQMRELIQPLDTPEARDKYRSGNISRFDSVQDINMRYRWDLLWASGPNDLFDIMRESDPEFMDSHVDSLLRSIVAPIFP